MGSEIKTLDAIFTSEHMESIVMDQFEEWLQSMKIQLVSQMRHILSLLMACVTRRTSRGSFRARGQVHPG